MYSFDASYDVLSPAEQEAAILFVWPWELKAAVSTANIIAIFFINAKL